MSKHQNVGTAVAPNVGQRRTRAQWKRQIAWRTRYRDFNKYGLPVNQIPASVMDRRRAASKAARKARRAAR